MKTLSLQQYLHSLEQQYKYIIQLQDESPFDAKTVKQKPALINGPNIQSLLMSTVVMYGQSGSVFDAFIRVICNAIAQTLPTTPKFV